MRLCRVAPLSNAPHGFLRSQRSSKMRPNPSVERTHNDEARVCAFPRSAAPSAVTATAPVTLRRRAKSASRSCKSWPRALISSTNGNSAAGRVDNVNGLAFDVNGLPAGLRPGLADGWVRGRLPSGRTMVNGPRSAAVIAGSPCRPPWGSCWLGVGRGCRPWSAPLNLLHPDPHGHCRDRTVRPGDLLGGTATSDAGGGERDGRESSWQTVGRESRCDEE